MTSGSNLQCMIKAANSFSYNQNFVPGGYLSLPLSYIHVQNLVIFKRLLWNSLNDFHQISHLTVCRRVLSICLNGSASLDKMAAMPIYGKKHWKIFFFRIKEASRLNLVTEHWGLKVIQVCLNRDPWLIFDLLRQSSLCICMGKILKIQSLINVLKTNGWNLQCMIKVATTFSYNQNFIPGGYLPLPLPLGYIHV